LTIVEGGPAHVSAPRWWRDNKVAGRATLFQAFFEQAMSKGEFSKVLVQG